MWRNVFMSAGAACAAGVLLINPVHADDESATSAHTVLHDSAGRAVGNVSFRETPNGVLITAQLRNLPPGTHGFHLHETGRCDPPTFESAGGHFAPDGSTHGFLNESGPHAGDMPNIHVPESGSLVVEVLNDAVTLREGARSLFDPDGAALMIHSGKDDYQTDPAGDAGDRIACGVIER